MSLAKTRTPDVSASPRSASAAASSECVHPLDQAYEEFHELAAAGRRPSIQSFCDRHPECGSALHRLLLLEFHEEEIASLVKDKIPDEFLSELFPKKKAPWPKVGERRGEWTLLRLLGKGRFARVFLAAEASTGGRLVVVKFSDLGGAEARTLGRLSHPHVVPLLSAGYEEESKRAVACMPYLGSTTLEHVCARLWKSGRPRPRRAAEIADVLRARRRPEDPPAAPPDPHLSQGSYTDGILRLTVALADTLAFVHARDVLHRDLKPSNVLLDPSGKPLLLDFNLAASRHEPRVLSGGTPHYSAPEQLRAFVSKRTPVLDARDDLFALGAMVYELLTGELPCGPIPPDLEGRQRARFVLNRLSAGVRPLRERCPDLERPVAAVLDRCLALDPAARPAGAAELATELRRQFHPLRRLRRWALARPRILGSVLALFLLVAVAAGFAWSSMPSYSESRYDAGERAYRQGNYDEAEQCFTDALTAEPGNSRYRFARGCARLKQSKLLPRPSDKLDQARLDLLPAEGPLDAQALAVSAYVASRRQKTRQAICWYNELEKSGYMSAMVRNNRAYNYIVANKFTEAAADLQAAERLQANCQAVHYNRALLELLQRANGLRSSISSQVLDDIERAIEIGPATSALHRDAGRLYAAAAHDVARTISVSPDAPHATVLQPQARERLVERAWYHLREAIAEGESAASIEKDPYLRPLRTFSRNLAELHHVQPRQSLSYVELRLMDPIDLPQ